MSFYLVCNRDGKKWKGGNGLNDVLLNQVDLNVT